MPLTLYQQTLSQNKSYTCDSDKCDMLSFDNIYGQYHKAYNWLSNEMTKRIGPPPIGTKYPVWAWYKIRNMHKKPNLNWREFRGSEEPMILIECEIDDNKVVLTDEEHWTGGQLNDCPCFMGKSDEELDAELDWYYDNPTVSNKEKEIFKMSTWNRIFNISHSENIQATFWELKPENIIKTWTYNKKS